MNQKDRIKLHEQWLEQLDSLIRIKEMKEIEGSIDKLNYLIYQEKFLMKQLKKANEILRKNWKFSRLCLILQKYENIQCLTFYDRGNSNRGIAERKVLRIGDRYIISKYKANDYVAKTRKNGFSFSFHHYIIINLENLKFVKFYITV